MNNSRQDAVLNDIAKLQLVDNPEAAGGRGPGGGGRGPGRGDRGARQQAGRGRGRQQRPSRMKLHCSNCGKNQEWDINCLRALPLVAEGGELERTKKDGRLKFDSSNAMCPDCDNKIMCNPLSAVCTRCDAIMEGFRPAYWKCTNVDGTSSRRVLERQEARPPQEGRCRYAATCPECEDYDRKEIIPSCDCPRLHGAIAGRMAGNVTGAYGWVMVH